MPEDAPPNGGAPGQIRQVRAGVSLRDVKRRFLAYSSPSRLPDPPHMAVLYECEAELELPIRASEPLRGVHQLMRAPTGR